MTDTVPMREMKVYQTDDGRRIEMFSLCGSIEHELNAEKPSSEFSERENIYIGVAHIMTEVGPKEIKFEIQNVNSIKEAFGNYYEIANKAVEEMKARWAKQEDEEENRIITVPADALDSIEQQEDGQIII